MKRVAPGGVPALVAALGIHGVALGAVLVLPSPSVDMSRRPPVRIRIAPRPKPKPKPRPPAPKPALKPEPQPEPKPKPKPQPKPKPPPTRRPRPVKPAEPPPPTPAPPAPAPAPRKFSVSMEATVPGRGVAVPTSPAPSKRGAPGGSPGGSSEGRGAQAPVPVSELTVLPRLLSQPTQSQMRAAYPEAARRAGLEADVRLRLLVGADGRVAEVRIVGRAGQGFDEVALQLVKRFRFRPGRRGGTAVPVWIPWTYKFRLRS